MILHLGRHAEVKRTGTDGHRASEPPATESHVIKLSDLVTAGAGTGDDALNEGKKRESTADGGRV